MEKTIVNGEAMSASQENVLVVEQFLTENYLFRRNILNGKVEFATKAEGDNAEPVYRPLTQEALNSIVLRALREEITEGNPKADIQMYVNSEEVPQYNPIGDFLDHIICLHGTERTMWHDSSRDCLASPPNRQDFWPSGCAQRWPTGCRWTSCTATSACPYSSALRVVARPPSCVDCCPSICVSTIWTT